MPPSIVGSGSRIGKSVIKEMGVLGGAAASKPSAPALPQPCSASFPPCIPFPATAHSTPPSPASPPPSTIVKPQGKAAIDFKWIRDNKDAVAANIRNRNSSANLDLFLGLYGDFLQLQQEVEQMLRERNAVANKMKGKLDVSEREALIEPGKILKERLTKLGKGLNSQVDKLQLEGQSIPNMTHPDVPIRGKDCSVVRNEVSGSKFYYLKNEAVFLEMALVSWALSEISKKDFVDYS